MRSHRRGTDFLGRRKFPQKEASPDALAQCRNFPTASKIAADHSEPKAGYRPKEKASKVPSQSAMQELDTCRYRHKQLYILTLGCIATIASPSELKYITFSFLHLTRNLCQCPRTPTESQFAEREVENLSQEHVLFVPRFNRGPPSQRDLSILEHSKYSLAL